VPGNSGGRPGTKANRLEKAVQNTEKTSLLTIALLAAFADGSQAEAERGEVRRVAESLASPELNLPALVQGVLLGRASVASAAAGLTSAPLRQLAYELAVGVCDADGLRNEHETRFLDELRRALGLSTQEAAGPTATADALASAPLDEGAPVAAPAGAAYLAGASVAAASPAAAAAATTAPRSDAELDRMILNYAILNGALELLPQSMASMAIIPLQMKMVYRIGKAHGYELDRGHIKDLLAAMGVGLTGQYLEDVGRKLVGGLFGKVAGGLAGSLARGATGAAFSFATTYALGHVARRYYAGGRTMNAQMLKDTYTAILGQARGLQAQYMPQIEQQARTVDVTKIVQMVRAS
jgi:uncharacterized protein (DUF697 family)/tellurite resistance protein